MGLHITITTQENNGVVFDDIAAMNAELTQTAIAELVDDAPDGAFVEQQPDGEVRFWCAENGSYEEWPTVWFCFDESAAKIMGKHCVAGSLVLREDIEGNAPLFFKIEPGLGREVQPNF